MDESRLQPAPADGPAEPAQDTQAAAGDAFEPPARKRSAWLIGGVGLLVIVLAAAAYVGGRWLNRGPAVAAAGAPGKGQMVVTTNNGGASRTFKIEPAKELPQSSPDLVGVLVRRQDNSLFLGTGNIRRVISKSSSDSGAQASAPTYDGPVLEAVVTHDTQILRDETNFAAPPTDQSSGTIQQVVKPGSLDEITTNSAVQVWGQKTGDRFIARILVYKPG